MTVEAGHAFAVVNGHRLRYRVWGEGPLAVFGHGLLGSIEQVEQGDLALEALYERVRLLVYDARGHGQSEGPETPEAYTWESLGLDMSHLVETYGSGAAMVGGASMGAATALWVAIERPELVRGLVLMMPPPLGHEPMRGADEAMALKILDALAAMIENFGMEQTVALAKQYPGFASTPAEAEQKGAWLLAQNPKTILHAIRGLLRSPYHDPEAYRGIKAPALVICHEGDGLHPARAGKLLAEHIPDCRLVVAPETGYWQKHPDELMGEIGAFLGRVG